ncbi:MAG: MSMEG_1061 family FMN-dependent PPOX-type flavoprotein [Pseudomonadales bacterium]
MTKPTDISLIENLDALQAINGKVHASTQAKVLNKLEAHTRNFIARSPFLVLSTSSGGDSDASPRGDNAGFVKVMDDTTLLIPERPGNRLADSLTNILISPGVGMIFMIPGMNETLRINGKAYITDESKYLDMLVHNVVDGKKARPPKLAIVIDIEQVYFHCAKAFIRSKLWNVSLHMDRTEMPTLGKMLLDQIRGEGVTREEVYMVDASLAQDAKDNLYHQQ